MCRFSDKPNVDEQIPPGWKISHLRPKSVGMIGSHSLLGRKTIYAFLSKLRQFSSKISSKCHP